MLLALDQALERVGRSLPGIAFAVGLVACGSGELEARSDLPTQLEVVTEARPDMQAAPTRSSALDDAECATQDDCPSDHLCVAVAPGQAECRAESEMPGVARPRGAPNGRPAPPIGLLDGQVMRDFAQRSAH